MTNIELIERIKRDFPLLPLPSPVVDELGGGFEPQLVQDYFQGKDWQAISRSRLHGYDSDGGSCLLFMNPTAFCYYLPSYMLMFLEDYDDLGGTTYYPHTFYHLTPPPDGKRTALGRDWYLDRFERFTVSQKQDIASYIAYEDKTHGEVSGDAAKEAYDSYWYQFDPAPLDQKTTNTPPRLKP